MIDRKEFGGNVGVISLGKSIYVASLFVLNIGLARSLGTEGFGSFQQVFIFSVVFMIFTLGIPETMYFFLPRLKDEDKSDFISQTLYLLIFSGIFVALLLWFGAPFLARIQNNPSIENSLKIFGVYGAFIIASSFSDPVFIIFKRVRYLFILSTLHGLFFIALTIWHHMAKVSIQTLFVAMCLFGFFKLFLTFVFLIKIRRKTGNIDLFHYKHSVLLQFSFAVPIALTNTIDIISKWLDKFVISFFLGTENLGIFSVGAIEIPFIGVFVASVYSVISPVLNTLHSKEDFEGFILLISKTLKFTAKIVWPIFAYLFMFADHLIPLFFTNNFNGAVEPFRVYLLLMPMRIFLFGVIIVALGQPRVIFWAALGSLTVNIFLNIFLVIQIGFLGPAIATVVSTYLQIIWLISFILVNLNVRIKRLIPLRALFDIGLTSLLAVTIAFTLTRAFEDDLRVVFASSAIFVGAYIFLGTFAGLFRIPSISNLTKGNYLGKKD